MGAEKDKALGRPVKNRDIDKIDEFCRALKTGTRAEQYEAQKQILQYFDSYLEKYVNIFMGMSSDCSNYDTRGFLAMFLTGRPKNGAELVQQKKYISKIMQRYGREEIKQELSLLFLTVLAKYRIVPGVNALNPLTRIFKWRVKDWFNKLVKDPLSKTFEPSDEDFDLAYFMDKVQMNNEQSQEEPASESASFDLSWVFQPEDYAYYSLTRYQRYLFLLHFSQGLSFGEMGRVLQKPKEEIRNEVEEALSELKELF